MSLFGMMGARVIAIFSRGGFRGLPWALGLLCAWSLLGLVVGSGVAFGVRGHEFGETIGWGVADGAAKLEVCKTKCEPGLSGSGPGEFNTPVAVAVNEATGEFYVVDEANGRVERFSLSGEYLGEFDASGTYEVVKNGVPEAIKGAGAPTGAFLKPGTVAIDNSCLHEPVAERKACETEKGSPSFDPSYGDVYVTDGSFPGHRVVDKFNAEGRYEGQIKITECPGAEKEGKECTNELGGVAVGPSGDVWIAEDSLELLLRGFGFDRFNDQAVNGFIAYVRDPGNALGSGLTVGREGELYAGIEFKSPFTNVVAGFSGVSGQELGLVLREQERSSGVAVEVSSGDVYVDTFHEEGASGFWSVRRFAPGVLPLTELEQLPYKEIHSELVEGRGVGVDSRVADGGPVYVADGKAHDVVVFLLEAPKPPTVEGTSVSAVTSGSAQLSAVVNPRGARTEYVAEIGMCGSVESCGSAPFEHVGDEGEGGLGGANDFEGHIVAVHPQNLQPGVTYHFRVLARNEKNAPSYTEGQEVVFTTQLSAPLERLDGRGWELVSPPQKQGALINPITEEGVIQAAANGDAITYQADSPTEAEPKGDDSGVQVLSRRTGSGWVSEDIDTSHQRSAGQSIGQGGDYRFFSGDLSVGLAQPFGAFEQETSPEATEQTPYRRTNFFDANADDPCTGGCYKPLVTRENTTGAPFGEEGLCPPLIICGPRVLGASSDGKHVVVSSSVGLVEGNTNEGGLFEWNEGPLTRVSVKENSKGEVVPASFSSGLELGGPVARDAVSENGSRVVWSEFGEGQHLFLWDAEDHRSIELDKSLSGSHPVYEAASADGSRVFFTYDEELYVYEVENAKLVRLTIPVNSGERTLVQGVIPGVSRDGSIVYFVADGKLAEGAGPFVNGCESGVANSAAHCFLYEVQRGESGWGEPRVVGVLSGSDVADFASSLPRMTVGVSPDGEWLVFMSDLSLTGYDNRDAVSGARDEEVFLFNNGTGRLVCVSCNPSGARPAGMEYAQLENGLVSGDRVWPGSAWLAANVPGWTPFEPKKAFHESRFVLDDGRVFFNAADALVPQDVNGVVDVYEFEPVGVGSCTERSVTFGVGSGGCVGLVSSGTLAGESGFVDASVSGSDVFFETANSLVPSDRDSAVDVYDARECGAGGCLQSPPLPVGPCLSEASCKGEPSVQPEFFGAPASQLFSGLGNVATGGPVGGVKLSRRQLLERALVSCRRAHPRSKGKRVVCEHGARARFASVAKRAVGSGKLGVVR